MIELLTGVPTPIGSGEYTYQAIIASGTTTLALSLDGGNTLTPITGASWTANEVDNMNFGSCHLEVTIGGAGGRFLLSKVAK